jgi:putative tryptophan/tyrosine transport system substrate-binding protein
MKSGRATLLIVLTLGLLLVPLAAEAQQAGRVPRIGILGNAPSKLWQDFEQRLRELGYTPDKNLVLEYRWSEARPERFPGLAADLVSRKVDLIVAASEPAVRAAKQATTTIPIVMFVDGDPVASGLVPSLAHPGGNITGLSVLNVQLIGKRLEMLKEMVPQVSRVAVLSHATAVVPERAWDEAQAAARRLGLALTLHQVHAPHDLDNAFTMIGRERYDGLVVVASPLVYVHRARIATLAAKIRVPAVYGYRENSEAGGLMSYATNLKGVWERAGDYVDRILKGAKPGEMPVEQPTAFELVINMKTARALGLTIPPSLLLRADQVIE